MAQSGCWLDGLATRPSGRHSSSRWHLTGWLLHFSDSAKTSPRTMPIRDPSNRRDEPALARGRCVLDARMSWAIKRRSCCAGAFPERGSPTRAGPGVSETCKGGCALLSPPQKAESLSQAKFDSDARTVLVVAVGLVSGVGS